MKKLITILGFLMIGFVAKAQFPFTQTVSNASTLYKIRGGTGVDSALVFAVAYADTTAANLGWLKNIAGAVIRTSDNTLWLRNGDANTWGSVGSGGGTPGGTNGQIQYNDAGAFGGTPTGTGVLTALGFNVGSAGAFVVNGGALGTPSSGVATNLTGTATALNIGGNAATATILQTTRTIQGISFNGSSDINIINGTGFVKATGTTLSYDNSTYLTTVNTRYSVTKGTGDSLQLVNDEDAPGNNQVYGTTNVGAKGWRDGIQINEANVEQNSWLKYDADSDEYDVFSIDSTNGKMEFITGVTGGGFPANGDSIMTDSNFIYRHVEVYREGDLQTTNAFYNYYYEHDSTDGNIIFHPPLTTGERVTIYTSWFATWSFLGRRTAPSPLVWTPIDFETNTNLTESPANTWFASTGAGWGQTGLNDTYKIPASTEAAYRTQITAATQWKYIMGIGTDDAQVGYASFTRGVLIQHNGSNFDIYRTSGASTFDTGVDLDVGDYCALWRYADGTVKIRKSVDGTNWTDVYAYGATSTADMFFKVDVNYISGPTSFGILVNPQVVNQVNQ